MTLSQHYVLAAGGTGGHMMPAHALAEELLSRGHRCALVTDGRGARIPGLFENVQVHILPAGRLSGGRFPIQAAHSRPPQFRPRGGRCS